MTVATARLRRQITMVPWNVFFKLLVMQLGASVANEEANIKQFLDFTRNEFVSAYEFNVFLKWFGPFNVCITRMLEAVNGGLVSGFVPALEALMLLEGKVCIWSLAGLCCIPF